MSFDPQKHLTQLKNGKSTSDYLEVKWRLVWFREQCPQGTIETKPIVLDLDKDVEVEAYVWNAEKRRSEKVIKTAKGVAVFHATVHDGKGASATGTKSENAANFPDFIEKAESGSIGRALAALGYGTQFTGDELNEKERIVDAPVERKNEQGSGNEVGAMYLTDDEVKAVKVDWAQVCHIKSENMGARWDGFKSYIAEHPVEDNRITMAIKQKMMDYLAPRRQQQPQNKAS